MPEKNFSVERSGGTGKWKMPGVPHKGWYCVDIYDLEEPSQICEMCEVQEIRYVHIMEHKDYAGLLEVGCICAGHMSQDIVGARKRENDLKNRQTQKSRWLTRKWKTSHKGNEFINTPDGYNIVVFPKTNGWGARVEHRGTGYFRLSERFYDTPEEMKLTAFEVYQNMKQREP